MNLLCCIEWGLGFYSWEFRPVATEKENMLTEAKPNTHTMHVMLGLGYRVYTEERLHCLHINRYYQRVCYERKKEGKKFVGYLLNLF
jgi:hypothetical protein